MREVKKTVEKVSLGDRLGRGLDSLIAVVAPKTAFTRRAYRQAFSIQASSGGYKGAKTTRLRSTWVPGAGSADEDLLPDLAQLRERSRDLNRNDAHAIGITNTIVNNTVGTGITPQSRVNAKRLGWSESQVQEFQEAAEDIFDRWTAHADAGERMSFYEMLDLAERQIIESGEAFIQPVMIEGTNRPYRFALDMIEPDRIATPPSMLAAKTIREGVKIGTRGEPVAYYVKQTHPGDILYGKYRIDDYTEVQAWNAGGRRNIWHVYHVLRPGQTRGLPMFAPVLGLFKDLGEYAEAELVAARVAACFTVFITSENQANLSTNRSSSTNAAGQRLESLEPGRLDYLAPGQKIETANPNRPNANFEAFVDRVLRAIATGLNLPYELVAKDFSKTNYSSARAALLQAYRYFRFRQKFLAQKFCQPAFDYLMEEAYLNEELPKFANEFYENRLDYCRVKWIAQGWQFVDPEKEANASEMAIKNNISTLADECATQGKDWEEVLAQRAREEIAMKALEETHGINLHAESPEPLEEPKKDKQDEQN